MPTVASEVGPDFGGVVHGSARLRCAVLFPGARFASRIPATSVIALDAAHL
jgi:hypothetical protein